MVLIGLNWKNKDQPLVSTAFSRAARKTWIQFASTVQIHGLKYIIDPKITFPIKVFWIIVSASGFCTANVLVSVFWERYRSNPTRMNVESNCVPLVYLDLPSVTICAANRISYSKTMRFIDSL